MKWSGIDLVLFYTSLIYIYPHIHLSAFLIPTLALRIGDQFLT